MHPPRAGPPASPYQQRRAQTFDNYASNSSSGREYDGADNKGGTVARSQSMGDRGEWCLPKSIKSVEIIRNIVLVDMKIAPFANV